MKTVAVGPDEDDSVVGLAIALVGRYLLLLTFLIDQVEPEQNHVQIGMFTIFKNHLEKEVLVLHFLRIIL